MMNNENDEIFEVLVYPKDYNYIDMICSLDLI